MSKNKPIKFEYELNEKEQERLEEWKKAIKLIYGEEGIFTYSFTPTGIGNAVKVYSHLAKTEKDITDLDCW
jgi:DNA-binding PadR family transcriptional regulator